MFQGVEEVKKRL